MIRRIFLLPLAIALVALVGCKRSSRTTGLLADSAMVVSAHHLASGAGVAVMQDGGNAVDAAIATHLVLAVVFPQAGNIGGGGFMIIRLHDGTIASLDFREKAPTAASYDMYLDSAGNVIDTLSTSGHLASGVPGSVAGLEAAHKRFGTLPWKRLVQPAIDIAYRGFPLSASEAGDFNNIQDELMARNTIQPVFLLKKWHTGDSLKCIELAHTLERIRDHGAAGFYSGTTADLIWQEMLRGHGLITGADLATYEAKWREPLVAPYKNYRIISMPPPSSGGVVLGQMLEMVAPRHIDMNGIATAQLLIEVERRAFADRATHLGDPDFYDVPFSVLLDKAYASERMKSFVPRQATPSSEILAGEIAVPHESGETTHFSIVDPQGNAVAVTTTVNGWFGSKVVVAGAGFFLNNEMDDFSAKPGVPNMFGVTGGEANKIEPGKRMLSSMTPTIVEKDGQLFMVVGSPGGPKIITAVFQTILQVIENGRTMQEAVNAPRFHHQWLPDKITAEPTAFNKHDSLALVRMGYAFERRVSMGRVDAVLVRDDGLLEGAADPRGEDAAAGF